MSRPRLFLNCGPNGVGDKIVPLYFAAAGPELCLARLARRVPEGGHYVSEADVAKAPVKVVAQGKARCIRMRAGIGQSPSPPRHWLDDLPACAE